MMQSKGYFLGKSTFTFGINSKGKHRDLVLAPYSMLIVSWDNLELKVLLPESMANTKGPDRSTDRK